MTGGSRKPFEPIDFKARWEFLYDLLKAKLPGEVVTFADLAAALNLDPDADRGKVIGALPRAAKELLEQDQRALVPVRGVGYQIAHPGDHLELAQRHRKRSDRQLKKSLDKVTNVDMSELDPAARAAFMQLGQVLELQMGFNRRTAAKVERLEELMEEFREDGRRSEAEHLEVLRRLERLEQRRQ